MITKYNNISIFKPTIKIKLLCSFFSNDEFYNLWKKMDNNNGLELVKKNSNDTYFIIINKPIPGSFYIPEKTIVFHMEPVVDSTWFNDEKQFMYFLNHKNFRNNTEWHLNKTVTELRTIEITKTKLLSSIVSSQYTMPGHRYRIDLLKYIEGKSLELDIYGRDNLHNFKNYKHSLPPHQKEEGLFPYKYTINAENCELYNYVTEKLVDAILSETLCFYWGCPNIYDFFDPKYYHLVIDTYSSGPNETVGIVLDKLGFTNGKKIMG